MTNSSRERCNLSVEDLIEIIGENDDLADMPVTHTSPLLWDVETDELWFRAFDNVEKKKGGQDLAKLIATREMPPAIRLALADLILRKFNPMPGKRPKPIYDLPPQAKRLFAAEEIYRDIRRFRTPKPSTERALAEAAGQWNITPAMLRAHLAGKYSATRSLLKERRAFLRALKSG